VAYVEPKSCTATYVYLSVKIPDSMARSISRDCADKGVHPMVYYADAFAEGLAAALTTAETKTIT
jgi:hypothetical protein